MTTEFKLPADVAGLIDQDAYEPCGNCGSIARIDELAAGLCRDCQKTAEKRPAPAPVAPVKNEPAPLTLLSEAVDELSARRRLREQVAGAADSNPNSWPQVALEAVRKECVRGRHGHEFTPETILAQIERDGYEGGPPAVEIGDAMRFVMRTAIQRGWCQTVDRKKRGQDGRDWRVYKSLL